MNVFFKIYLFRLNEGELLPVFVYSTNCTGNERRLSDCSTTSGFNGPCNYAVTITCNGKAVTTHCILLQIVISFNSILQVTS